MVVFIFLIFGPFIYYIVSIIVDSFSDKVKEVNRKKYHGSEEIIYITTYQNSNITEDDIMHLFVTQLKTYKKIYFNIEHKVYNKKDEQNYAWSVKTTKQVFGWGIVYNIQFHFSNGYIYLSFSDDEFTSGGTSSSKYYLYGYDYGTSTIENILNNCKENAAVVWKINGKEPNENLPFNYVSLFFNAKASSSTRKTKNQNDGKASAKDTTQADLLAFYRNLLSLKLCFSQSELKKSYHEAVKKYHPDKYGSSSQRDRENAEMLMKQVNEAYERLKEIAA